jgi:RNA polymerase sigma-70 factor (ECF subfamily)
VLPFDSRCRRTLLAVTDNGTTSPVALGASAILPDADETIDRLRADVERAVRRICPGWLVDQIDDLIQVATVRIVQRLRDTAGTSVVLTPGYVYRTAYTSLVDEIRKRRRLREVPIEHEEALAVPTVNPERRVAARATGEAIRQCMSSLLRSRRRAVMLHLQGHSLDETSVQLGCSRKKADNLVYRGLSELRACLKARGFEP